MVVFILLLKKYYYIPTGARHTSSQNYRTTIIVQLSRKNSRKFGYIVQVSWWVWGRGGGVMVFNTTFNNISVIIVAVEFLTGFLQHNLWSNSVYCPSRYIRHRVPGDFKSSWQCMHFCLLNNKLIHETSFYVPMCLS